MSLVDPQVAMDKLAGPGSSQAIAAFLHDEGVTGMRQNDIACPVYWYMRRETGWRMAVRTYVCALRARDLPEGVRRTYRMPKPVRDFVRDFDDGRYPELAWSEPLGCGR